MKVVLLFAKDISVKDHKHLKEEQDRSLKSYMEYQRNLFPYTVFRAGLDLAYKELDDILNYVDNQYRPLPDSPRKEYPADVGEWFRNQYPWSSNFLNQDAVHTTLVILIQGMESYRTYERLNAYHWMVLYDVVHNAVQFYNDLLTFSPDRVTDIRMSQKVRIHFDDFINNYWCRLDFMILSKPDYPHERLLELNYDIETVIRDRINEGDSPPLALEKAALRFNLEETTVACLRHDLINPKLLELKGFSMEEDPYAHLYHKAPGETELSVVDLEYSLNHELFKKSKMSNPPD